MRILLIAKRWLDRVVEAVALILLVITVLAVSAQVVTRTFFDYTPSWSEEVALLSMVWFSFIGIAVGFKENLHIGVSFLVNLCPDFIRKGVSILTYLIVLVLGYIFITYGWTFTVLMSNSTMAGTQLPSSFLYAAIPVAGVLLVIYGMELLIKLFTGNENKSAA